MVDRDPVIVNNSGGRSGSGGWAVAIIILLAVVAGLVYFMTNGFSSMGSGTSGGGTVNADVNVNVPRADDQAAPSAPVQEPAPAAPATSGGNATNGG